MPKGFANKETTPTKEEVDLEARSKVRVVSAAGTTTRSHSSREGPTRLLNANLATKIDSYEIR